MIPLQQCSFAYSVTADTTVTGKSLLTMSANYNYSRTRSTRTVHTSTKARLTSVITQIAIRISDPDCHQNLIIGLP